VDILVNNAAAPGGLVRGALTEASEEALLEDIKGIHLKRDTI
jgi:hypothetical protein